MSDLIIGRRENGKLRVRGPSHYEIGPLRFFKLHHWLRASGSRSDGGGERLSLKFHKYLQEMGTSQTARDIFPWATSRSSWWFIYPLETCWDSVRVKIKRSKVREFLQKEDNWKHVGGAKRPSRFPSARGGNEYWSAHCIRDVDEQKKKTLRNLAQIIAINIKQQRQVRSWEWKEVAEEFKKMWIAQSKKEEQNEGLKELYRLSSEEVKGGESEGGRMDKVIENCFKKNHNLDMSKLLFAYAALRALYGETEEEDEDGGKQNKKDGAEDAKVIKQWATRALKFKKVLYGTPLSGDERNAVVDALNEAKNKGKSPWREEWKQLIKQRKKSGETGQLRVLRTFRLCKYVRHCLRIARTINSGRTNRDGASS
jgi:hypothetical protein